ncbi:MAG TPA: peptidylprolyl isomerase [Acidimicrobiales bacterium]|nr:peptidylprolyl isomerase [Acidimicrobiales bacterium]
MPSTKRERQRAAREARREAEAAAFRRARARKRMFRFAILAVLGLVAAYAVYTATKPEEQQVATDSSSTTTSSTALDPRCPPAEGTAERTVAFTEAPPMCIDASRSYTAVVETDAGTFNVELFPDRAPVTVNNFVFLARNKYYDDVPFHRVIPGFVVQGGDAAKGDGTGGPGYQFGDELPKAGDYELGSLAMANSGPDTNGSQFFVITGEQGVNLPPSYSLFGKVVDGMDVAKKIEADGSPGGTPTVVHKIVKVTIEES